MSVELRDVHVSQMHLITESNQLTPPSSKYERISIPDNPNRHCLGWLEGPAASLVEDTRNDRWYNIKLWKNVLSSDSFLEGMQNAVIIGENDHPEERVDYSLANGSVILTDIEIREDEGIVWARFAILDNIHGKILLSYLQFGSVVGASSRGIGDEIIVNGRNTIDPDTYEFFCFDIVAFPAATVARQTFIQSNAIEVKEAISVQSDFHNRIVEEINKASSIESLDNLQRVVESTNVSDKTSLIESISNKLSSLSESADNQSTNSEEVSEQIKELTSQLESKDVTIADLREKLEGRKSNAQYFRRKVQEQGAELAELEEAVHDGLTSIEELSKQLESLSTVNDRLKAKRTAQYETINAIKSESYKREQLLKKAADDANEQINQLHESQRRLNVELSHKTQQLVEANAQIQDLKAESTRIKTENRRMKADITKLESQVSDSNAAQKQALTESRNAQRSASKKMESLTANIKTLEAENRQLESLSNKKDGQLKENQARFNQLKESSTKLLKDYLKRSCEAANLKYESVLSYLPKNFTQADIDSVVKEMADRQVRFDTLPISVPPIAHRVVEHYGSGSREDEAPAFVIEALRPKL